MASGTRTCVVLVIMIRYKAVSERLIMVEMSGSDGW